LLGNFKKGRGQKQGIASSAQGSSPDGKHTVGTLMARDYKGFGNQDIKDGRGLIVYENHPTDSRVKEMGSVCTTVTARWGTGGGNVPFALAENTIGRQPLNGGNGTGFTEGGPMYTLNATGVHGVAQQMAVRRLTPIECERLQGFPDNHTNIPWRKKEESPDGPRYKAMGNSMAVPVMHWIGKQIQTVEETV
jgi:DNA (cytosine-5)-methyltransferase 1